MPGDQRPNLKRSRHISSQRITLLCLAVPLSLTSLSMSIMNGVLPELVQLFDTSIHLLNLLVISYLLSITAFLLVAGSLGDRYGYKSILRVGITIFIVASGLGGLSDTLMMLIAARLIQGIGAALVITQIYAIAGANFGASKIGSVMGFLGTMTAVGTALGPLLGSLLLEFAGWPFIFWLMLSLGALSLLLSEHYLSGEHLWRPAVGKTAKQGALFLVLSLLFYSLSVLFIGTLKPTENIILFLLALAFGGLFIKAQKRNSSPFLPASLFAEKRRNLALTSAFVIDAIAMSTLLIGPFYLAYVLDLSLTSVGLVASLGPMIGAISGFPAGRLVDRYSTELIMKIGLFLVMVGTLCFAYLPLYFAIYGYILSLFILTPARQMFHAANGAYIIKGAAEPEKGKAAGLINLSRNLGLITGGAVFTRIFNGLLDAEMVSNAQVWRIKEAFSVTFCLASIIAGIALTALLFVMNKQLCDKGQ